MNFLQRAPFFRLLLAFVAGSVLYAYVQIPFIVLITTAAIALATVLSSYIIRTPSRRYRFRWLYGAGILLFIVTLGYGNSLLFDYQNRFTELNNRGIYEVEIIRAPIPKARSYMLRAKLLHRLDSGNRVIDAKGKAIIYLQKDSVASHLLIGDRLIVDAEFKAPDGQQNPNGFDYAAYLKRQGVGATTYISSERWKKTGKNPSFLLGRIANKSRSHLLDIYRQYGITDDEFAVLAALTLGFTDSLEPDIYKLYSHTGAVHILSVSGLHVGIVYVAIFSLLGFLRRGRKQIIVRALISVLFIWMYAIITGLSPAVLRASVMLSFVAFGTALDRKPQIYNTIMASAFLLLIFNPNLLFNIGFQLSYSAVLSIVTFQSTIYKWLVPRNKMLQWIWMITSVSLAAQLGTAPISIYYFSQFPNYFLLTNYVAIPLSTGIIYLAIGLFFVSFIPTIATWTGFILKWMIWLMNHLLMMIVNLPGSLTIISITNVQLWLLIASAICFIAFSTKKKFIPLASALSCILLFFILFGIRQYESLRRSRLIVFSDTRTSIVNFIRGKHNFVYTTDELQALNTADAFWRASLLYRPKFVSNERWLQEGFGYFAGKRIVILSNDWLRYKTTKKPLKVDYLILTNRIRPQMNEILDCIHPELVIIDKSISAWYTNHIKESCKKRNTAYYSIAEQGAFIAEF